MKVKLPRRRQRGRDEQWLLLLLFSRSVMSSSLQPHGLQHARLPCPSLSPRVCSNSCPLNWWCHATISSSECWNPPKKVTPHPRAKEKQQQDGRRGTVMFKIKPHTRQWCTSQTCVPQDPGKGAVTPDKRQPDLSVWLLWDGVILNSFLFLFSLPLWVSQIH